MRVLAIDQGSSHCGFAVGEIADGKITRLQNHGRIVEAGGGGLVQRVHMIGVAIRSLIMQYRPDTVLVEDIHWAALKTKKTIYALVAVTFAIEAAAAECLAMGFERMNVSTVRKVLGSGPTKAGVRSRVSSELNIPIEIIMDDNHSDALGLLLAYAIAGGVSQAGGHKK